MHKRGATLSLFFFTDVVVGSTTIFFEKYLEKVLTFSVIYGIIVMSRGERCLPPMAEREENKIEYFGI